jgi:hypothetical protein
MKTHWLQMGISLLGHYLGSMGFAFIGHQQWEKLSQVFVLNVTYPYYYLRPICVKVINNTMGKWNLGQILR